MKKRKSRRKNTKKIFVTSIIILITAIIVFLILEENNVGWKKINMIDCYYTGSMNFKLDLDGDNKKENITTEDFGKYLHINENKYKVNKNSTNIDNTSFLGKDYPNKYYIVDLNNDGVKEIIHDTYTNTISPITHKYTIYNYKNNKIKEIAKLSISGNIPSEVYVKNNTVKFKYHPYETEKGYTKTIRLKLK